MAAVPVEPGEEETILVRAVEASHSDARLARALPLCFWHRRNSIDVDRLLEEARKHRETNAVGFFLDLTAQLSDDARFSTWARVFRDRRVRSRDFFVAPMSKAAAKLAASNTPRVARDWGLRMNLDFASFKSLFDKFDAAAE